MDQPNLECAGAVAELREQGLTVRLHSRENNTWHIADGGLYSGYVASSDELVGLRRAKNLNIRAIKNLGLMTPLFSRIFCPQYRCLMAERFILPIAKAGISGESCLWESE